MDLYSVSLMGPLWLATHEGEKLVVHYIMLPSCGWLSGCCLLCCDDSCRGTASARAPCLHKQS